MFQQRLRPAYETQEHLEAESAFAQVISQKKGVGLEKLPRKYVADFIVTKDDQIIGVAEIKCRHINIASVPTVFISFHKLIQCAQLASEVSAVTGKPPMLLFFFRFDDGDFYYKIKTGDELSLQMGGRTVDTRDDDDIEPMLHIPKKYLKRL